MTAPAVLFPDAAAAAIVYLRDELGDLGDNATVGQVIPNPRPARFVTVRRVGGPRGTVVSDRPLLAVEAWGESDEDAHDLAQTARGLLYAMRGRVIDGVTVYRVNEAGGPVNLPDPDSQQARYTFTLEVNVRGVELGVGS